MGTISKWQVISDPMLQRRMGKTGEELGELMAVVSRIQIQGIDEVDPGTGKTNRLRLEEEIADVYAQLDENLRQLALRSPFIYTRRLSKVEDMKRWEALYPPSKDWDDPEPSWVRKHFSRVGKVVMSALPAVGIVAIIACIGWMAYIADKHHIPAQRWCPYGCMTGK